MGRFVLEVGRCGQKRIVIIAGREMLEIQTAEQLAFLWVDGAGGIDCVGGVLRDGRGNRRGAASTIEFGDRLQHGNHFSQILANDDRDSIGIQNGADSFECLLD